MGGWGGLRGSVGEEFLQAEGRECGGPGAGDGSPGASGGCCQGLCCRVEHGLKRGVGGEGPRGDLAAIQGRGGGSLGEAG